MSLSVGDDKVSLSLSFEPLLERERLADDVLEKEPGIKSIRVVSNQSKIGFPNGGANGCVPHACTGGIPVPSTV